MINDQILDVFKGEPTGFVDRLNVRCAREVTKGQRRAQIKNSIWGMSSLKYLLDVKDIE